MKDGGWEVEVEACRSVVQVEGRQLRLLKLLHRCHDRSLHLPRQRRQGKAVLLAVLPPDLIHEVAHEVEGDVDEGSFSLNTYIQ